MQAETHADDLAPSALGAVQAQARLQAGSLTAEALVHSCLDRIEAVNTEIQAWTFLDPDLALTQAKAADERRASGAPTGPLHGLPIGIKDIIDTHDMPTENGSALHAGRRPEADATLVARLREAGAIIMGKTVTTEFAVLSPGKTRNPHDPGRTPGGSSSGSAAAVASFMVPAALGSQTNGSMIRPASFCGVCGYKPTFGLISRGGVFRTSQPLDTMGVFGRSVQDTALIAQTMIGFDAADPDTRALARPPLVATAGDEPPLAPNLAFVKSPVWDAADADVAEGFAELVDALGGHCREVPLPSIFDQAGPNQRILHCTGLARYLGREYDSSPDGLSDNLREMIEEGRRTQAVDYLRALEWRDVLYAALTELFDEFDAIITPAATGEAPTGLESTGNPVFCALWTYSGVPAISLPLLQGSNGLPIGVQLVGRRRDDARLLRTARWLVRELGQPELA